MVARYAGASLGLLGFTITIVAGMFAQNPATVTLSRGILALFGFCVIGLVLGSAAQLVVNEHERKRESEIQKRYHDKTTGVPDGGSENRSTVNDGRSIGT